MVRLGIPYLRVSTRQQGASGLGLEAQRAAIEQFCSRSALSLVQGREYVEVESGLNNDRPQLQRALAACRAHRATLIVAKLDRLSRNAAFLLSLRDAGVDVVACDLPEANRLVIGIMAMIAEWEAEQIATRTREGLAAAKARGKTLGGARGTTVSDEARRRSGIARRAAAAQRARDILSQVDDWESMGASDLARALTEAGIPARGGQTWSAAAGRHLVRVAARHDVSGDAVG